jgi:hypothetical protein
MLRRARGLIFALVILAFACALAANAFAVVSISVKPRRAPVTLRQTQQFRATVLNTTNTGVTWFVDGVKGGNSTVGTITTGGLYTPPRTVSKHTVTARSNADTTKNASATVWVTNYPGMFTYHGEQFRSGVNVQEFALQPSLVNATNFGKLFTLSVDGQVYAQPLHVANRFIGGVFRNVLYVATEHDSVYAFDADGKTTSPLWKRSFINPTAGITTIPKPSNGLISPEVGITSTPAIDRSSQTLYVVAATVENGVTIHRLHALSLTSGAEKFGGPVVISGTYGGVTFSSAHQLQRPALLLLGGVVYITFGSHGDRLPYQGWVFAYTANTTGVLHPVAALNTAPQNAAAIWMSGGGPAADPADNIYLATGNGPLDLPTGGLNAGDCVLKLSFVNGVLQIVDFYSPSNEAQLNAEDLDLGTGGITLPPFQSGAAIPNLAIIGGKDGVVYVVNRDNMGKFSTTHDNAVQKVVVGHPEPVNGNFFTPANWTHFTYFGPVNDSLKTYQFTNGVLSTLPVAQSTNTFPYPGATPTVSANSSTNGIVWAIDNSKYAGGTPTGAVNTQGPAVLHAYNANNIAQELYNSAQKGTRDTAGTAIKFTVPTVANGRVYVGGAGKVTVYGFLP